MNRFQPDGWPTVTPRIFTDDVEGLVAFLRSVFHGSCDFNPGRPAEVKIGDSMVMVSHGDGVRAAQTAFLYVYVEDAEDAYRKALDAGAVSIEAPTTMPYGDRRATIQDGWGNTWQIATRLSH
ncbi:MAG: VOC family protein [Caulobacterales bacterium]